MINQLAKAVVGVAMERIDGERKVCIFGLVADRTMSERRFE